MNKSVKQPIPIDERSDDPYPTDAELRIIQKWNVVKYNVPQLIDYIKSVWWAPDWGFHLRKGRAHFDHKACMKLELHTGGWSGNEDVVESLGRNFLFWSMTFRMMRAGGHFYFEIPMSLWDRNLTKTEYDAVVEQSNKLISRVPTPMSEGF